MAIPISKNLDQIRTWSFASPGLQFHGLRSLGLSL